MTRVTDAPLLVFVLSFLVLALSARVGAALAALRPIPDDGWRRDLGAIQGGTLTLLALLVGASFSMALGRYDQRKEREEAEANALHTEYLRVELLPGADVPAVRGLLLRYLDERVSFYGARDEGELRAVGARTEALKAELWSAVRAPALAGPTPVGALAVAGMNDLFDAQGFAEAAWSNRIPASAWGLMATIAVCANLLLGLGVADRRREALLLLVLPLALSVTFLLVADIESPRLGLIQVVPENLLGVSRAVRGS